MATRTLPDPDPSRLGRRVVFELSEQELPLLDAAEARHGTKRAGIVAALAAEAGAAEREARLAEAERQREAALEALGQLEHRLARQTTRAESATDVLSEEIERLQGERVSALYCARCESWAPRAIGPGRRSRVASAPTTPPAATTGRASWRRRVGWPAAAPRENSPGKKPVAPWGAHRPWRSMAPRTSPAKATPPAAPATRAAAPEPCPVCAGTVTQRARGRRRRYCSAPCRKTAHRRRRDGAKRRALVRLVEADARQFLAGLPSESVDLIVTDPPYHFARGKTYFRVWFAELPDEVWSAILAELHRVLRRDRHAYVFCNRRMHPLLERAAHGAGFRVHPPLIWDKDRLGLGSGPWRSSYELILFLEKGRRAGNHKTLRSVLRARAPVRRFPTEKPVEVLGTLIGQASRVGELVLDPFCGSGSVGQAARALGRRVLLCDVNAGLCRAQVTSRPDGPGGHGSGT